MDKVPITAEGHAALKEELQRLREERPKISAEIGVAREHGDLRENAEYHAAKDRQGMVEARIADIEDNIARADIIDAQQMRGDRIAFGAYVQMEDTRDGREVEYRIVGPAEADIELGKISVTSPVGRALIGREVGDEVTVKAPGGDRVYEVSSIRWPSDMIKKQAAQDAKSNA